jgi:phage terminase Nu1 subunit (DNA packaging protein)|tara:strand:+ start:48 stop:242 length:195 start_codon:yes stop_codon:yes gene_type:complete
MDDRLLTTKELCDMLAVSRQAVYKWRQGGMPVAIDNGGRRGRVIRYSWNAVVQWLNSRVQKNGK